jgi:esterase/lipase
MFRHFVKCHFIRQEQYESVRDKELLWLAGSGHIVAADAERHTEWERVAGFIDRVARSA